MKKQQMLNRERVEESERGNGVRVCVVSRTTRTDVQRKREDDRPNLGRMSFFPLGGLIREAQY